MNEALYVTISSRTPEGDPNVCPICGNDLRLEPSIDTRDGPCPSCGHLLWFPEQQETGTQHGRPLSGEVAVMRAGKARFGPIPVELLPRLNDIVDRLICQDVWPTATVLRDLVARTNSWNGLLAILESLAGYHPMYRLGKTTGRFFARVKRLVKGTETR